MTKQEQVIYKWQAVSQKDGGVVTITTDKMFPFCNPDGSFWEGTILDIHYQTAEEYRRSHVF